MEGWTIKQPSICVFSREGDGEQLQHKIVKKTGSMLARVDIKLCGERNGAVQKWQTPGKRFSFLEEVNVRRVTGEGNM